MSAEYIASIISTITQAPAIEEMIGLDDCVERINMIVVGAAYRQTAHKLGAQFKESFQNTLFIGPQGVGKTTMAKILAFKFKEKRLCGEKEPVRFVKATNLTARYLGQSGRNMTDVLNVAKNGVLIIDEIDALLDEGSFGQNIINALNTSLSDNVNKPIVICTLYGSNEARFLQSNSGLAGRFRHTFRIESYDEAQLWNIFSSKIKYARLFIDKGVDARVQKLIEDVKRHKKQAFANAREIDNIFDAILDMKSKRMDVENVRVPDDLISLSRHERGKLVRHVLTITVDDIPEFDAVAGAFRQPLPVRPIKDSPAEVGILRLADFTKK